MTGWILGVVGKLRVPLWAMLLLALVALALLPLALLVDGIRLFLRVLRVGAYVGTTEVFCPRGHLVRVSDGAALWTCGSCGYGYLGSGFAPCPRCRAISAFIQCYCGASVKNPVWDLLGDRDAS